MSCYRDIKNGKPHNVWIFSEKKIEWNKLLDDEDIVSKKIEKVFGKHERIKLFT